MAWGAGQRRPPLPEVRALAPKAGAAMRATKTDAQRQADLRQRHRDAGRVPVTVWVLPEWKTEVRELEAKLQRRENRKRGPAP